MPLIKITRVKLNTEQRPEVSKDFVTDVEWNNLEQSLLRQGAKRTNAGKVFTLFSKEVIRVYEILIK